MATNYKNKTIRYSGPDRLSVVPNGRDVLLFSILVIVGVGILVGGFIVASKQNESFPHVAFVGCGGLFLMVGVLGFLLRWRFSFDRQSGEFKKSNAFSSTRFPLGTISSVDVKDGGLHEIKKVTSEHNHNERGTGRYYRTWRCRIVVKDSRKKTKITLSDHPDYEATSKMASEIAKFLDVPLGKPSEKKTSQ